MVSECAPDKKTDVYGEHISDEQALHYPRRVGSNVLRTIYAVAPDGWERMIGTMDTPELAEQAVTVHNRMLQARYPLPG